MLRENKYSVLVCRYKPYGNIIGKYSKNVKTSKWAFSISTLSKIKHEIQFILSKWKENPESLEKRALRSAMAKLVHQVLEDMSSKIFMFSRGLRMPEKSRFPVTLGYTKTYPRSVPGYTWIHKNVTKVGFRWRSFTQKGNQGRLSFTLGYTRT